MFKIIKNIVLSLIVLSLSCQAMDNPFYTIFSFINLFKKTSTTRLPQLGLKLTFNNDKHKSSESFASTPVCQQDYQAILNEAIGQHETYIATLNYQELMGNRSALAARHNSLVIKCDEIYSKNSLIKQILQEARTLNFFSSINILNL